MYSNLTVALQYSEECGQHVRGTVTACTPLSPLHTSTTRIVVPTLKCGKLNIPWGDTAAIAAGNQFSRAYSSPNSMTQLLFYSRSNRMHDAQPLPRQFMLKHCCSNPRVPKPAQYPHHLPMTAHTHNTPKLSRAATTMSSAAHKQRRSRRL